MLRPHETRANGYTSQALMHFARNRYREGDFVQWRSNSNRWGVVLGIKGQHTRNPDQLLVRQLVPTSRDVLVYESSLEPYAHADLAAEMQRELRRETAGGCP